MLAPAVSKIDAPAITQMRNRFAAPLGSLVASGAVPAFDVSTLLSLKVMSNP
jgi:hypothetical protein